MMDTVELEQILLAYILKVAKVPTVRLTMFSGDVHKAIFAMALKQHSPVGQVLALTALKKLTGKLFNLEYEGALNKIYKIDTKALKGESVIDIVALLEDEARVAESVTMLEDALAMYQSRDVEKAEGLVRKVLATARTGGIRGSYTDNYDDRLREVQERQKSGIVGVPTGLATFDATFGGALVGEYGVVIGESSIGKSQTLGSMALCAWLADLNVFHRGHNVVYVSLEMSAQELEHRADANLASIAARKYRMARLSEDEYKKWDTTMRRLRATQDKVLCFEYLQRGASVDDIFEIVEKVQDRYGIKVDEVLVDSINLVGSKEWDQQAMTSADMKHKAQTFGGGTVVWTCTQIAQQKKDAKPEISVFDTKYSQAIAHDANIVWGLVQSKALKASGEVELQFVKFRGGKKIAPVILKPQLDFGRMFDTGMIKKVKTLQAF